MLLCDDSALVRSVVAHTLASAGFEVTCVEDPKSIAAEVDRFHPDALLVDASYPDVTDDTLVALVASHATVLPVVLFSDRSTAELTALAGRIGARGAVPKDGMTLATRLNELLD